MKMSNINYLGEMGRSRSLHGICIKVIVLKKVGGSQYNNNNNILTK